MRAASSFAGGRSVTSIWSAAPIGEIPVSDSLAVARWYLPTVRYQVVLPSIYPPYTEACLATCKWENILVVDNASGVNRGVSASWNMGVDEMWSQGADWLILLSAGCRFGDPGGEDFLEGLAQYPQAWAVEATKGIGWHMIGLNRKVFDHVGYFDENLFPGDWNDNDMTYRVRLSDGLKGLQDNHPKIPCDVTAQWNHGRKLGGATSYTFVIEEYFRLKWADYSAIHPFADPSKPISWWPTPPDPRCIPRPVRPVYLHSPKVRLVPPSPIL